MKILVLNCGSSSIKFQVVEMPAYEVKCKGSIGRIGYEDAEFKLERGGDEILKILPIPDHEGGIHRILETLFDEKEGMGFAKEEITAVGHRVVQGGNKRHESALIDEEMIEDIERIKDLAPLHNPNHLAGIYAVGKLLPTARQVAVFDNGFHATLPKEAYLYGLPYEYYEKYGVRRYGFHGIAFRSMAQGVEKLLGRKYSDFKIVNMMLGSGTTANAVLYGKSVEVSTGFTPHEGLIQSTRGGDVDAAAVLYIMKKEGMSLEEADEMINKKSGWKGLSGLGNDMREIKEAANKGNERCQATIDAVCHRFKKYIGAYSAILGGIDLLVFSGGVGENATYIREQVCRGLEYLGIQLDKEKNDATFGEGIISAEGSRVKVLVTRADEEQVIAEDTYRILSQ